MANYWPLIRTTGLLFLSNCFMTAAWYGHLRFPRMSLIVAILVGWLLALPEYALQVPANRLGYHNNVSGYQLKILQECITLVVFVIFAWLALGETPQLKHGIAFTLIVAAVLVAFR
jgi:uncharacterized protein (DUF486 family)